MREGADIQDKLKKERKILSKFQQREIEDELEDEEKERILRIGGGFIKVKKE